MTSFVQLVSRNPNPRVAIEELQLGLGEEHKDLQKILFYSHEYSKEEVAQAVSDWDDPDLIGCSTAGEISPDGYEDKSMTLFAFGGRDFLFERYFIQDLDDFQNSSYQDFEEIFDEVRDNETRLGEDAKSFALLLIDGLSAREELTLGKLSEYLINIPLIGGSSGDGLNFGETGLIQNSMVTNHSATVLFVSTSYPFELIKGQHFEESDQKLVITDAIPEERIVKEINGLPAAEAYAEILGVSIEALNPTVYSNNPVMLKLGDEFYVRSIQKANDDGSLTFYCAIDVGLVLTLAKRKSFLDETDCLFEKYRSQFSNVDSILAFECILRRLEVKNADQKLQDDVNKLYKENKVIGFHTYGEQFGKIHINQTFTGVIFGKR